MPGADTDLNQHSAEATIETSAQGGGTESTCNTNNNAESSTLTCDGDPEKSLYYADELMEKGAKASKENDYGEAVDCYSRALEIRVAHFGELAPECVNAYYKYGCALLYKAQEEANPFVSVLKKEGGFQQDPNKDGLAKRAINGESSITTVSSSGDQCGSSDNHEKAPEGEDKDQGEHSDESDDDCVKDDLADADEYESDLDLGWKMLDLARAIVEKHSADTMEKVDILSALAEVALEREDVETSLSDYLKALTILERLVEADSRYIAELNFRICLCLEIGSKHQEAIPYCQKAISVCKSRVQRLGDEVKSLSGSTATSDASESNKALQRSSSTSGSGDSKADKEAEIQTLTGLASELEKKLEDLQQLVSSPPSILADILCLVAAKAKGTERPESSAALSSSHMGTANSSRGAESPTVSTARTNGAACVTNLGVVGRGVKRVNTNSGTAELVSVKKNYLSPFNK